MPELLLSSWHGRRWRKLHRLPPRDGGRQMVERRPREDPPALDVMPLLQIGQGKAYDDAAKHDENDENQAPALLIY